jgi:methyl-accepting chemotaxis protein
MKLKSLVTTFCSFKLSIFVFNILFVSLLSMFLYFILPTHYERYIFEEKQKVLLQCITYATPLAKTVVESSCVADQENKWASTELINDAFKNNQDFEYYVLNFTNGQGERKNIKYNEKKAEEISDVFNKETEEILIIKKKGMLNIIVPLYSDALGQGRVKIGNFIVGFSLKSLQGNLRSIQWELMIIFMGSLLLGYLIASYLQDLVVTPLEKPRGLIEGVIQGDLTQKLLVKSKDEMGQLLSTLNKMVSMWKHKMQGVKETLEQTSVSSNWIAVAAHHQNDVTSKVASFVSEVTSTAKELDTSSRQVFEKARQVAERSGNVLQIARDGMNAVEKSIQGFKRVHDKIMTIARYSMTLSNEARQIESISNAFKTITHKTEMLAINADIEAAKADEQGKGFFMVAQEVRKLVEQSKKSAATIASLVAIIQKSIQSTLNVIQQSVHEIEAGIQQVMRAKKIIETAITNMNERMNTVDQISLSSKQQMIGTEQITSIMVNINEGMKEKEHSSKNNLSEAEKLSEMYRYIHNLIGTYKI